MVKDAEAHSEEDKKFQELVNARNQADALIHNVEKTLKESGDKVEASEKAAIEKAVKELKDALKSDSKEQIDASVQALTQASSKMAERMYREAGAQQQGQPGDGAQQAGSASGQAKPDNVVDAEFEEVKEVKDENKDK